MILYANVGVEVQLDKNDITLIVDGAGECGIVTLSANQARNIAAALIAAAALKEQIK